MQTITLIRLFGVFSQLQVQHFHFKCIAKSHCKRLLKLCSLITQIAYAGNGVWLLTAPPAAKEQNFKKKSDTILWGVGGKFSNFSAMQQSDGFSWDQVSIAHRLTAENSFKTFCSETSPLRLHTLEVLTKLPLQL